MKFWGNFLRKILITLGVSFGFFLAGSMVYFASQVSATYPPLKEYPIDMTLNRFEYKIRLLSADKNLNILREPTTGDGEVGYRYHRTVQLKIDSSEYRFGFDYELERNYGETKPFINLRLIGAYDLSKNIGGSRENDKGVSQCVDVFEKNILTKLILTKNENSLLRN